MEKKIRATKIYSFLPQKIKFYSLCISKKMCMNTTVMYILLIIALLVYMNQTTKQRIIDTAIIHPASL
jgi:hypothetical protein